MGEYELRALRSGDETSLLETFNLVFGEGDPAFRPRTPAEWSWAFEHNPAGQRVMLALAGEQVVAQYAALPTRVWIDGTERRFAQIVDSMVHPEHRGAGRLFVRCARAFFEAYGSPERDLVHYGWPVERALKIGRRSLGYEVVRTQLFLVRELAGGPPLPPEADPIDAARTVWDEGVVEVDDPGEQLRWLYERCVGAFGASTVRDEAWFRWRFRERPGQRYRSLGVRDADGCLRGLCVLTDGEWPLPRTGVIVDWLVPPSEPEVAERLLRAACGALAERGARRAVALFPEWSPWFEQFQERGFLAHPSDYCAVARAFHPHFDSTWLRDHWWYQLSDTDLV